MSSRPPTSSDTFASPGLQDEEVQQKVYPSGLKFAAIMVAVCLSFILVGLDSNIIATAVPSMTRHFGTINDIAWYTSVYRLMSGSFQLMFGKLYTLFPAKILILASLATFVSGTLLCAHAPSSPVFILGRAITGFATAGVISGAFAMVIHITPLRKRSTYAGIGAAAEAVASLTTPLFGGLLTDRLSWRRCFFLELPLIAGACIIVLLFLDLTKGKHVDGQNFTSVLRELDVLGTAIFVPAITSLLLALQWGGNKYEWSDWRAILLLCIFAALRAVFVLHQSRLGERATLPSRILLYGLGFFAR
ncbi:major facilitator superfamily domain-containing protein [Dactylonectria estremocensis]|uniref:Major facilitator superfamily domain-containing protein n=1 Tax=Dactylonectria estremocensis TaxID=1079267 RepID=A0A9P9DI58_9HYPO|nr:major facilitator superfamily domain-containing protein [Dactylonectria estremocensis]